MGDHAIANSGFSYEDVSLSSAPVQAPVPPQVLARWAAIASERACFGVVPRQVVARS